MSLDVTNPDHCEALAWACEALRVPNKTTQGNGLKAQALVALSTPEGAAEVIRQLVERAGLNWRIFHDSIYVDHPGQLRQHSWWICVYASEDADIIRDVDVAPLIARLIAIAPDVGAEAVLAALRGANETQEDG